PILGLAGPIRRRLIAGRSTSPVARIASVHDIARHHLIANGRNRCRQSNEGPRRRRPSCSTSIRRNLALARLQAKILDSTLGNEATVFVVASDEEAERLLGYVKTADRDPTYVGVKTGLANLLAILVEATRLPSVHGRVRLPRDSNRRARD